MKQKIVGYVVCDTTPGRRGGPLCLVEKGGILWWARWDSPATVFASYERARNAARRYGRKWGKEHKIVPLVAEPKEDML